MAVDVAALAVEIGGPAYAGLLPDSPGRVVALLNAPTETMKRSRFVTARTVLAELGGSGAVSLDKLEQFAAGPVPTGAEALHSATRWAMRFLTMDTGLDIGHPNSQSMLTTLVATGTLTLAESEALKGLAIQPAAQSEILFGAGVFVTEDDVRAAMAYEQE